MVRGGVKSEWHLRLSLVTLSIPSFLLPGERKGLYRRYHLKS